MPTRKQRRRKAKTFRHEFDFVTYDDAGNQVEVDRAELRAAKAKEAPKAKSANGKARSKREQREVKPPSWRRSLRRGLPMGAVMLIVVVLLFKNTPIQNRIVTGLLYAAAFVPFTYWLDRFAYRNYLRKQGKG
jgi:cytochrome c-type biogenesis protein CcmH/NrfG